MRRYVKCCRCAPSTRASRRGRREDVCRTSRRRSLRAEPPWPSWGVIATLRLWCATLAAHAVALPPPSTPRRISRPLALALACAIAASTSHLQLALASPAPATSSLSRLVARSQLALQSYLSFVDRFGGEGAASEPGGFKASAGPPPAAGMLCCYSKRCKGAPKAAEAFSATQRKANKNLRRCKVCIADQVGQLEKTLFGDECRHTRQATLTTLKVVAPIGPCAITAAAVELSPSAQSTQALPPAWPAWRFCNLDKALVYP